VDKVSEPTTAQIKRFFEENKKREFNPTRPETGFATPKQIAFSYIKGIPSQKLLESIAKEDIEKYYEENKDTLFLKPIPQKRDLPNLPGMTPGNFQLNASPTNLGNLGNLGGLGNINIIPKQEPTSENTTTPVANPPELTAPDQTPKEQAPPNVAPKPETTSPEPKNETETEKKTEAEKEVNLVQIIRYDNSDKLPNVKLISFQNEPVAEVKEPVAAQPADEKPADQKPADEKPVDQKPVEQKPADEKPVVQKPAEEVKVDGGVVIDSGKYRPLSEVESGIRLNLAQAKIDEVFVEVEDKLREHYDVYRKYVDMKVEKPTLAILPPAPPNLSSILERCDLKVVAESLGTIFDVMRSSEFVRGVEERDFIINWFKNRPYEYQSSKIGNDFSRTIVWATDYREAVKPESIDGDNALYDKVIKRWKEVEAREVAFSEAQKLAETATAANEPLATVFASKSDLVKVTDTEPFTWMTFGYAIDSGSPIRLSEVREKGVLYGEAESGNKYIFAPGEEFMEVASSLEVGGVGTVFNQPKNTVHIVRLISATPSDDDLWERFKTVSPQAYSQIGQQEKLLEAREAWLEGIRAEMDFKWINKPTEE
jgi:hypothetical protein